MAFTLSAGLHTHAHMSQKSLNTFTECDVASQITHGSTMRHPGKFTAEETIGTLNSLTQGRCVSRVLLWAV